MTRDGFQLVQEAVSNWESLDGVARVDVVEEWLGNTSERGFMAKVVLEDEPELQGEAASPVAGRALGVAP